MNRLSLLSVSLAMLVLNGTSALADADDWTDPVVSCANRVSPYVSSICAGVKTEAEADAVVACADSMSPYAGRKLCRGVKTGEEAGALGSCVKRVSIYTLPTCAGVKTPAEADAVVACVNSLSQYQALRLCGRPN